MTLLNTSVESEKRILTKVGVGAVLVTVAAVAIYLVANPPGRKPHDVISVAIETPYVGQGVAVGTPVIMHGVKMGEVKSVSSIAGGGVRLQTDLQRRQTVGLTDAMQIDFRPSNYFGVTGVNVTARQSGRPLQNGMQINMIPKGNFSLQALLYRFGELSNGVFNQRMVSVVDRATRYVDGLDPLLETALIVGHSVAKVQTVSTERLLKNATGVSVAFPGFLDALLSTGDKLFDTQILGYDLEKFKHKWKYYPVLSERVQRQIEKNHHLQMTTLGNDDFYNKQIRPLLTGAVQNLFLGIGNLEANYIENLFPLIGSINSLVDTVPEIESPEKFAYTLTELRKRFERIYGGSGDQRALQVRIILDRLPGVAAPLGMAGRP